jgi:hypothetical protein
MAMALRRPLGIQTKKLLTPSPAPFGNWLGGAKGLVRYELPLLFSRARFANSLAFCDILTA